MRYRKLFLHVNALSYRRYRKIPQHVEKPPYTNPTFDIVSPETPELKTTDDLCKLRTSCQIARKILNLTAEKIKPGITTDNLDEIAHNLCIANHVYPSPLAYRGYPKSICTSVNHVACHGIPNDTPLKNGDILNIDVTVYCQGFHGDVSETYTVGNSNPDTDRLITTARKCRDDAIQVCRPGARFCDIGNTISAIAKSEGYSVIPNFCGHGIGTYFHGPPDIIHIAYEEPDIMLEGMTFTIEPIICAGSPEIRILNDGWTAVTVDKSLSAQFEHTIAVTQNGVEILTL